MRQFSIFLLSLFILLLFSCKTSGDLHGIKENPYRIAFYNVENLFDTKDDPNTKDEEFTPQGRNKWTEKRLQKKLINLTRVVAGMNFPAIVGVAEVENQAVLDAWCNLPEMKTKGYEGITFDSPDFRGIDVGLLYQKKAFTIEETELIRIDFPKEIVEDYTTRDILLVKGNIQQTPICIVVNHWPSRRGGLQKSEPKRTYVASQLTQKVNEILSENPTTTFLFMGDFNDETTNKSIADVLTKNNTAFVNMMADLDNQNQGTYNYRGNWNMLDQIIVSPQLANGDSGWKATNPTIFREDWMMYQDKKYGAKPNRTYGGPNYYGGYSDHLPVYIDLLRLNK